MWMCVETLERKHLLLIHPLSDTLVMNCDGAQPGSMRIWAFLFGLFWESFVVYYVLWKSYRRMLLLRDIIVTNSRARPQQYTVLVRDIPKLDGHETRTDQVSSFFRRVHPGYYGGCLILNNLRPASASLSIPSYSDVFGRLNTHLVLVYSNLYIWFGFSNVWFH